MRAVRIFLCSPGYEAAVVEELALNSTPYDWVYEGQRVHYAKCQS